MRQCKTSINLQVSAEKTSCRVGYKVIKDMALVIVMHKRIEEK